jgi:hypothetical protein
VCPEIAKSSFMTYKLHADLGNRMVLRALGLFQKFFRAESEPKMRFGCIAQNLMHRSGFYYPPPEPRIFSELVVDGSGAALYQRVSSEETHIDLAEIPFLRLREALDGGLPLKTGPVEAVRRSQLLLDYLQGLPILRLDLRGGEVALGEFSFIHTKQLTAVSTFFLQDFNGPASKGTTKWMT